MAANSVIPGLNIDLSGIGPQILQMLYYGVIFIGAIGILIGIWWWWKEKKTFCIPVTLYKLRADGSYKEVPSLMGGVKNNRVGVRDFKIKIPGQWKKHSLGYMPDFSMSSADDRLHFVQLGDGRLWQQCKKDLVLWKDIATELNADGTPKEIRRYSLLVEPIPTDVKTTTINDIHEVKSTMEKNKISATAILIGGFILEVLLQVVFLYFTTKK